MSRFTQEELHQRAFERTAWVLRHFWEEQQDNVPRSAAVHSRLFDTLIYTVPVIGTSRKGGGHKEHLVPCALLRDLAFQMFWEGESIKKDVAETEKEVAKMLKRLLCIAYITPAEARFLDHDLKFKTIMPLNWNFETGSIMARLEEAGIELVLKD